MKSLGDEAKGTRLYFCVQILCHSLLELFLAETGGSLAHAGYMAKALKNVWD